MSEVPLQFKLFPDHSHHSTVFGVCTMGSHPGTQKGTGKSLAEEPHLGEGSRQRFSKRAAQRVQGYLAHKKPPTRRTLQSDHP